jgi:hypothetical protein
LSTVSETVERVEMPANGQVRDSRATLPARACGARNRRGEPCRSRAVLADGFCFAHSALAPVSQAELGRRGGLVSGEVRREQAKSVRDRLRERVEAEADEVWRVFRDAWDAVDGEGGADHRARLASAEGVLAQAYGRPPQAIVGDEGKPVMFVLASLLERAREEAER